MNVGLLDRSEVSAMLKSRMDSGEFWFLIPDSDGASAVQEIERRYYDGEAAKDFDCFMLGALWVATARKSRMSPRQLYDCVKDELLMPLRAEDLETHDVIFLCSMERAPFLTSGLLDIIEEGSPRRRAHLN